eukprot:Skav208108  [mRNA]  locus=scaffold3082:13688:15825:- [translate_table: standard]
MAQTDVEQQDQEACGAARALEAEDEGEDPDVLVQGMVYRFSEVLGNDELQEQMTDQEYQRPSAVELVKLLVAC